MESKLKIIKEKYEVLYEVKRNIKRSMSLVQQDEVIYLILIIS